MANRKQARVQLADRVKIQLAANRARISCPPAGKARSGLRPEAPIRRLFALRAQADRMSALRHEVIPLLLSTSPRMLDCWRMSTTKILSEDDLLAERARLRDAGQKFVFTNGVFDILHVGHVRYLAEARALGDALV